MWKYLIFYSSFINEINYLAIFHRKAIKEKYKCSNCFRKACNYMKVQQPEQLKQSYNQAIIQYPHSRTSQYQTFTTANQAKPI